MKKARDSWRGKTIETARMTLNERDVLKMALALGGAKLGELGVGVRISCELVLHCQDGVIFDRFPWRGALDLGGPEGMGLALHSKGSRDVDQSVSAELASRGWAS